MRVGANRILRAGRFHHPCGDPDLPADAERQLRRRIVRAALEALTLPVPGPTVFEVEALAGHA